MAHLTNKKKAERDKNALLRGMNGFNTGTRTHRSAKDYNRQRVKLAVKKGEF